MKEEQDLVHACFIFFAFYLRQHLKLVAFPSLLLKISDRKVDKITLEECNSFLATAWYRGIVVGETIVINWIGRISGLTAILTGKRKNLLYLDEDAMSNNFR